MIATEVHEAVVEGLREPVVLAPIGMKCAAQETLDVAEGGGHRFGVPRR